MGVCLVAWRLWCAICFGLLLCRGLLGGLGDERIRLCLKVGGFVCWDVWWDRVLVEWHCVVRWLWFLQRGREERAFGVRGDVFALCRRIE